jgi:putrescine aminotransferase
MGDLPIQNIHHIGEPYWYACPVGLSEEKFGLQSAQELEKKIL